MSREDGIGADHGELLLERLRHQQAVEGAVVERQAGHAGRVPEIDGEGLEAVRGELLREEAVERRVDAELTQAELDVELGPRPPAWSSSRTNKGRSSRTRRFAARAHGSKPPAHGNLPVQGPPDAIAERRCGVDDFLA
jgi:hypothetical protein